MPLARTRSSQPAWLGTIIVFVKEVFGFLLQACHKLKHFGLFVSEVVGHLQRSEGRFNEWLGAGQRANRDFLAEELQPYKFQVCLPST